MTEVLGHAGILRFDQHVAGLAELTAALRTAPPGLTAMTFLADVSSPREFWARRQTHETTVHAVTTTSSGH